MISSAPLLETSFPTLTLHRRGKVRDVYEVDDDHLLIVATDRISAFDYVLGIGHSRQGQGADAALGVLVRLRRAIVRAASSGRRPMSREYPGRAAAVRGHAARALDAGAPHRAGADRVRGARLHVRIGLEGLSARPGEICGVDAAAGPARERSPARADLHAGDEGRERPRREHQRAGGRAIDRRTSCWRKLQGADARRSTRAARRTRRRAASSSPTRSSSSGWSSAAARRRRDHPDRRGDDARLVALLAGGQLRARRRAAELRQAVRARLSRVDPAGTSSRPCPACPTTWSSGRATKYLDAFRRLTGPRAGSVTMRAQTGSARPGDGRQGHPLRRCPAGVRAALHPLRARRGRGQHRPHGRADRHAPQHAVSRKIAEYDIKRKYARPSSDSRLPDPAACAALDTAACGRL